MTRAATTALATSLVAGAVVVFSACEGSGSRKSADAIPTIVFHGKAGDPNYGAVDVTAVDPAALKPIAASNATENWNNVLAVYTGDALPADRSVMPLLGRYSIHGDTLRFTPRFPPVPGQPYFVRFNGSALSVGAPVLNRVLLVHMAQDGAPTQVAQVYPSDDSVPMNLLRMYVHFSAPMSIGESTKRVRLLDARGQEVDDAFLVIPQQQELWDSERTRLTLLFDPGRIKRDLRPHEELGLPLREGGTYTLVVDSSWLDARGKPLGARFEKRFRVGPADRTLPAIATWQVSAPKAATREPVHVSFRKSFDRALLERLLVVKNAAGQAIAGEISIGEHEKRWTFTPAQPWRAGNYLVEVNTDLEDLAGNNLRDLFDVDRNVQQTPGATSPTVRVPFAVRFHGDREMGRQ
jgi:hypothetical protein